MPITPATDTAVAEIELWLDAEEAAYQSALQAWADCGWEGDKPVRGFRCNWDSVKRGWREGRSRLDVLSLDGETIGFLDGTDILEVRPDLRGKGYGRLLAQFMVGLAREEGRSIVEIEITPTSAEPFWRRMGFTLVPGRTGSGGGVYAYLPLSRTYALGNGKRVAYEIAFYTERGRYADEPTPFSRCEGSGERLADGSIQLPERVVCFEPENGQPGDYFVRVVVDGIEVHFDKCKRPESRRLGIQFDKGYIYFMNRLVPAC